MVIKAFVIQKGGNMKLISVLNRYETLLYTVLRIVAGFLFLWHGTQKLLNFPHAGSSMPAYVIYIAGPIEFLGGLFIMTGLWTRIAAFICSGEMAYAYWTVHAMHGVLPLVNHGELAVLYCFLFLFIFIRGAGKFSIDYLMNRKSI